MQQYVPKWDRNHSPAGTADCLCLAFPGASPPLRSQPGSRQASLLARSGIFCAIATKFTPEMAHRRPVERWCEMGLSPKARGSQNEKTMETEQQP